jgi:multiple sugar transport system ATP-binding protein
MAGLTISNICKHFGSIEILKGIDLTVQDGEFLILVGPSGCGKSTLLNMIAGLDSISSGDIIIGDRRVNDISPKDRNIAMVFQSYALYPSMSVRDNIDFAMRIKNVPQAERDATLARVSKILQIDHLLDRKPAQLSGGQRQRVAMGRALARDPSVFLFDEPLSNLDAQLRVEMRAEIKALHQSLKSTIVYVTHDQIEAMTLGDKIAVMKDGHVMQFGTPADIYDHPANIFVASFIGSPTMNFLAGTLQVSQGVCSIKLKETGESLRIPTPLQPKDGQSVVLGFRPEQFSTSTLGDNNFAITINMLEPTGADIFATGMIGNQKVTLRFSPKTPPVHGQTYYINIDKDTLCLFDADSELLIPLIRH